MAKGRHLKPEFFTDKNVVSVTPLARLLYQGLWCYAADCGHLDDEPLELKMRILPGDNCNVDELLDELGLTGRVERKDGVLFLPKLRDHARVDKRYETVCEACKERQKHAVTTTSEGAPSTPNTTSSRSDHDVTTQGSQRDHDADGDGDGDGDGEVMVKVKAAPKRATALPDTFRPSEKHQALAAQMRVDLRREWPKFCDHHRARGSTFKDWSAALNTWIRKAAEFSGNVRPLPTPDDAAVLPPVEQSWMRRRPE